MTSRRQPPPHPSDSPLLRLNRSEAIYLACDEQLGSVTQTWMLALEGSVSIEQARAAVRRVISAFPRLRGALELVGSRYQLRILPDDHIVNKLFTHAFRVENIALDDPQAVALWHTLALNEPLPLYRGLGVRAQFAPHPTHPVLLLTVHHILIDGRSVALSAAALLKLLNGHPLEDLPLEDPSMLPAVLPLSWRDWPAKWFAAWRHERALKQERACYELVRMPRRACARFASSEVKHLELAQSSKAVNAFARNQLGSSNSLLLAAMGTALLELNGNRPGTAALMRVSVDLRRYFPPDRAPQIGNYVAAFEVLLPVDVPESNRIAYLDDKVRRGLDRFKQREMMLPLLPYEALGLLTPHAYTRLIMRAKRLDRIPPLSYHLTNLGDVDFLNPKDATVRLREVRPVAPGVYPLIAVAAVNERMFLTLATQLDEYESADVDRFMEGMRGVIDRWMTPAVA